jgi:predicted transcriptional regulator
MKEHKGMRPHDIAILLKIASKGKREWFMKDIAFELGISSSEVSESINRSSIAGLISNNKRTLNKLALLDFLSCGLQYVYPQRPGAIVRGIGTAHSAAPLNEFIESSEHFVWPYAEGNLRGQAIEPLHHKIPEACIKDEKFYELMALADAIRVGSSREKKLAVELIKDRINDA